MAEDGETLPDSSTDPDADRSDRTAGSDRGRVRALRRQIAIDRSHLSAPDIEAALDLVVELEPAEHARAAATTKRGRLDDDDRRRLWRARAGLTNPGAETIRWDWPAGWLEYWAGLLDDGVQKLDDGSDDREGSKQVDLLLALRARPDLRRWVAPLWRWLADVVGIAENEATEMVEVLVALTNPPRSSTSFGEMNYDVRRAEIAFACASLSALPAPLVDAIRAELYAQLKIFAKSFERRGRRVDGAESAPLTDIGEAAPPRTGIKDGQPYLVMAAGEWNEFTGIFRRTIDELIDCVRTARFPLRSYDAHCGIAERKAYDYYLRRTKSAGRRPPDETPPGDDSGLVVDATAALTDVALIREYIDKRNEAADGPDEDLYLAAAEAYDDLNRAPNDPPTVLAAVRAIDRAFLRIPTQSPWRPAITALWRQLIAVLRARRRSWGARPNKRDRYEPGADFADFTIDEAEIVPFDQDWRDRQAVVTGVVVTILDRVAHFTSLASLAGWFPVRAYVGFGERWNQDLVDAAVLGATNFVTILYTSCYYTAAGELRVRASADPLTVLRTHLRNAAPRRWVDSQLGPRDRNPRTKALLREQGLGAFLAWRLARESARAELASSELLYLTATIETGLAATHGLVTRALEVDRAAGRNPVRPVQEIAGCAAYITEIVADISGADPAVRADFVPAMAHIAVALRHGADLLRTGRTAAQLPVQDAALAFERAATVLDPNPDDPNPDGPNPDDPNPDDPRVAEPDEANTDD